MSTYAARVAALLSPAQARVFKKLHTPQKIQSFLEALPQHFVRAGEGMLSPRGVLAKKKAHCMEGAVLAAAILAYHGRPPLLLDIQSTKDDEDHVLALFKQNGRWGAISKTNHALLRWRDPVYTSVRELAMSYFNEYFVWWDKGSNKEFGKKTMTAYSRPFDLRRYAPERWVTARSIDWLAEPLDNSPHSPALPTSARRNLRNVSLIEAKIMHEIEWRRDGKKKK